MDSSTVTCLTSLFVTLGVSSLFCLFYSIFDGKSDVNPDQMPHYVVPALGLYCLPMTLLQVSR